MKSLMVTLCLCLISQVTLAQSPYAGMQTRTIKALSDQQIADLKAGRGMGLAMAAELNGYPGPIHVLELSEQLALSADQKARVEALFKSMKMEAVPLGAKLLALEENLDQQFANHSITSESLKTTIAQIGVTQAELRNTHLKYHLQTAQILSIEQMQRYSILRGYSSEPVQHHQHMQ
jgi:hypothetical protein